MMSQRLTGSVGVRYRLEQLLGQGGMGSVYRAHDRLTGQRVALKLVALDSEAERAPGSARARLSSAQTMALSLDALAEENDQVSRESTRESALANTMAAQLQTIRLSQSGRVSTTESSSTSAPKLVWARMALAQEFRTLAALRHPHIISVLDYGFIARSQPFFTMELLQKPESLRTATKGLSVVGKALLLAQLLRALSYLHRHGILHRDLKPGNVMVLPSSDGFCVKLLDFGLAVTRSHMPAKVGEFSGTLSYMAPEIFESKQVSEATDLFAVGVIAYELFTRRHPFDRGNDQELVASILSTDPDWTLLQEQPGLVALLRRLLARSPAARPSADEALMALFAAVGLPVPQETAALRESTLQAARFVGRHEPFTALRTALDAARSGAGEVQLLAGESGVGKSRLLEELRTYSLVQGVLCGRGQAVSEGGGAYSVWREILRTLCLCTELPDLHASVLKSILPDLEFLLEREVPDVPALNAQAAQLRLIHAIEYLVLQQTEPLLLLLEDLHWADPESLALLRRLVSSCRDRPILIVASYRDDERPHLPQELPGCPVLKLARLSAAGITELCVSILGVQGCTPELVAFVESQTEGNVLFIIEVLRALAEDVGQLSLVSTQNLPQNILTGGIQAIVQRRLARLPVEARPLLRLAAVAGRQLDLDILRQCEPLIEPWLYLAADAAVLEPVDHTWRFAHDKIRESLLLELGAADRQQLHLALARALESTYPNSAPHAAVVAEHYQRGGDSAKAAFYLVEAGAHALSQGAPEAAAVLLKQALAPQVRELLQRTQAARAYNCLIQATSALGWIMPCIAAFEQFMTQVGTPMPVDSIHIAAEAGAMLARRLRRQPAVALLTADDRLVWSDVAHAIRWVSEAYVYAGQTRQNIIVALRGAELAEALGDKRLQSYFLAVFSYIAGLVPLRLASRSLLNRGSRILAGLSNVRAELDFGRVASAQTVNAAEWELAKFHIDALDALARQVGDEYSLMFALACRLIISFREGDEAVFDSVGPALYHRSRRNQNGAIARTYRVYQGIKALRRGDTQSAQAYLAEAEGYLQTSQDVLGRILLGGLTALCLLRQGQEARALGRAQETMVLVDSVRLSNELVGEGLSAITELYLTLWEAGNSAQRKTLTRPLGKALAAMRRCARVFPSSLPRALLWHGRYAFNLGAGRLARQLTGASQRSAKRIGMPFDEALARIWIARFAAAPTGADTRLLPELRGILQLLTGGLG